MKKNCLLMAVAGLALAAVNAPETMAQETTGVEIYRTSTLQVTGVTVTTDGEYNFKNFEVEAPEAGSYYTEFWLLPELRGRGAGGRLILHGILAPAGPARRRQLLNVPCICERCLRRGRHPFLRELAGRARGRPRDARPIGGKERDNRRNARA